MIRFFQRGYRDRDKRTRAIWFARERKTTEIPRGGAFVVLFEAATEIIHIHARTSTAHCRLVVAMLLIGGSYERDDRQVEISYHWLSAHYANIHSECQTDTISRSCLSRFAKAFLRLSLSLSLSPCVHLTVAYEHTLCHFWSWLCFTHSQYRALSRNHIRICDHVTAYRLDFVSNTIHDLLLRVV